MVLDCWEGWLVGWQECRTLDYASIDLNILTKYGPEITPRAPKNNCKNQKKILELMWGGVPCRLGGGNRTKNVQNRPKIVQYRLESHPGTIPPNRPNRPISVIFSIRSIDESSKVRTDTQTHADTECTFCGDPCQEQGDGLSDGTSDQAAP